MANGRRFFQARVLIPIVLIAGAIGGAVVWFGAKKLMENFEPTIRAQAIEYLQDRFDSEVQLQRLDVSLPRFSAWKLWRDKGKGSIAMVEGTGLVIKPRARPELPPLFAIQKFHFDIDLGILSVVEKHVPNVELDGVVVNIPPKGQRDHIRMSKPGDPGTANAAPEPPKKEDKSGKSDVIIDHLTMRNSRITIIPKRADRKPLDFTIQDLKMTSAGAHQAMNYEAKLRNPKPDGWIDSKGQFGPFNADEPGDSPLNGKYVFKDANLGVFKPIAGILQSTGQFEGTLDTITAKGEARVPDFRLTRSGNPVSLQTTFECLVDGTNGNTILKPVRARLGTSSFTTSGGIVKHEKDRRRSMKLKVDVPKGEISDFLRLAMKGDPILKGPVTLKFDLDLPPFEGKVKERLILDGTFHLDQARFLQDKVADKVEELSARGQGKPGQDILGETFSQMRGSFHMEDQAIQFRELMFSVPGAKVDLVGGYDMGGDMLDFHGSLALDAKVSQTLTGWKRWAAKPLDPFFAKNGAGTFLRIQVVGPAKQPSFGLDKSKKGKDEKSSNDNSKNEKPKDDKQAQNKQEQTAR